MHKLSNSNYGIKGNLLQWIRAFLSNRSQVFKINSHLSSSVPVTSGVPQGSVLGPLLFLLFINDLTDTAMPKVSMKLFADDLELYTDLSYPTAQNDFQTQLNLIHSWASSWQVEISYEKSNILNLNPKSPQTYYFETTPIPLAKSVNDLGILIEPNLKFNDHIQNIIVKSKQRASLIYRSFLSNDIHILTRAFTTYVRPLLEYASPCMVTQSAHTNQCHRKRTKTFHQTTTRLTKSFLR